MIYSECQPSRSLTASFALNSYRAPIGKDLFPTMIFQRPKLLNFGGVTLDDCECEFPPGRVRFLAVCHLCQVEAEAWPKGLPNNLDKWDMFYPWQQSSSCFKCILAWRARSSGNSGISILREKVFGMPWLQVFQEFYRKELPWNFWVGP